MFAFALHNLLARRLRTLLALIGLGVAIAGVVGLVSFAVGLRATLTETADEIGGIMVLSGQNLSPVFSRLSQEQVAAIARVPGVSGCTPEILSPALKLDGQSSIMSLDLGKGIPITIGLDPVARHQLRGGGYFARKLVQGTYIPDELSNQVVISLKLAERLGKQVGSPLRIGERDFVVSGIYESQSPLLGSMIVMHISHARDLMELKEGVSTAAFVEAEDPADTAALADRIRAAVPGVDALSTADWASVYGELSRNVDLFLGVITAFAVVAGAIGIANTMLMSVTERIGEIGVLRATGWSRRDVLRMIIVESLVLGLAGGLAGVILGIGAGQAIALAIELEPYVSPGLVGLALGLAAATGTLGGLYPAWRAARLDVVAAICFRDL